MSLGMTLKAVTVAYLTAAGSSQAVAADTYPTRPVTIVSGYAPGGPVDAIGRLVSDHLHDRTGQSFILETKAGASGVIAAEHVARSAPDGYTLLVTVPSVFTMVPFMTTKPRVQAADLAPVAQVATAPLVLVVHPSVPANSASELVGLLKTPDNGLTFGSAGTGTLPHFASELFLTRIGGSALHVPFKGSAQAIQNLAGGQVQFMFDNLASSIPLIKAGRLRALAVTSGERFEGLPDVPTLAEAGVDDYEVANWFGIFAPKGTPDDVLSRLYAEISKLGESKATQERITLLGAMPSTIGANDTSEQIRKEIDQWAPLIRQLNLQDTQ